MFYAHFVLAKKGPLARIWLAAHWDKKLTKAHVFETNIEKSVDGILQPKVKMALRTSGHLLLGVVRIYSRKAKYLLADCNEAFVKIKMAFRPGMVDLPEDIREAAVSAITFPEVFHDFDTPMPELNDVDIQAQFTLNQSRAEEITMREDYGNISLVTGDDGFGDMGFEEPPELMRATSAIDQNIDQSNLIFGENIEKERDQDSTKEDDSRLSSNRANASALDLEAPIRDDGFGGNLGQDIIAGGLFEGGLFDDAPIEDAPPLDSGPPDKEDKLPEDSDDDDDGGDLDRFGGPPSVGPPSSEGGSPCPSPHPEIRPDGLPEGVLPDANEAPTEAQEAAEEAQDQTTLLHNDEESFALAPVDSSAIKSGWPRTKRKRKLIVDEVKNISGEEMKAQLSDTTDIITTLDLAPPSKRLMHWKETGGVEKLFALPGRSINAMSLAKMYVRHLTSEHSHNEDFGMAGDKEIENLRLEQVREEEMDAPPPRPRGRPPKRKFAETEFPYEEERVPVNQTKSGEESFNELIASKKQFTEEPEELHAEVPVDETLPPPPEPVLEETTEKLAEPQENKDDNVETEPPALHVAEEPIPLVATQEKENANAPEEPVAPLEVSIPSAADVSASDVLSSPVPQEPQMMEPESEIHAAPDANDSIYDEPPATNAGPFSPPPCSAPFSPPTNPAPFSPPASAAPFSPHANTAPFSPHANTAPFSPHANVVQPFSPHGGPRSVYSEHHHSPSRAEDGDDYEEQAEDETYEQFEERVVNKRAGLMFHNIKKKLKQKPIIFTDLLHGNNRKQVAQKFYTMLVLKKLQAVELTQQGAYAEMQVSRGILFENAVL